MYIVPEVVCVRTCVCGVRVCVCTCVCVVCVCAYMCVCGVCVCACTCERVFVCVFCVDDCVKTDACVLKHMHTCVCVCVCVLGPCVQT